MTTSLLDLLTLSRPQPPHPLPTPTSSKKKKSTPSPNSTPQLHLNDQLLGVLWLIIEDHDNLFVLAEAVHFAGIAVLAYKLVRKRNCGGLSLQTQILTAAFLGIRLLCSFMMEYDIHTLLVRRDSFWEGRGREERARKQAREEGKRKERKRSREKMPTVSFSPSLLLPSLRNNQDGLTLSATLWVIYQLAGPLKDTYQAEQDALPWYVVAAPCLLAALAAHPTTHHPLPFRVLWAACVFMEALSVLPQLRMMQRAKVVEKFTAHYVFALGLSRFVSCAHWLLQIVDGDSFLLKAIGSGLWPAAVLLSEIVQTLVLADFCFYYVKSYAEGSGVIHLAAGIV